MGVQVKNTSGGHRKAGEAGGIAHEPGKRRRFFITDPSAATAIEEILSGDGRLRVDNHYRSGPTSPESAIATAEVHAGRRNDAGRDGERAATFAIGMTARLDYYAADEMQKSSRAVRVSSESKSRGRRGRNRRARARNARAPRIICFDGPRLCFNVKAQENHRRPGR